MSLRKPAFTACVSSQVTIIINNCALATEIYDPLNAYTSIVEAVGAPADEPDEAHLTDCAHVCAQVESPCRWTSRSAYRQQPTAFCSAILAYTTPPVHTGVLFWLTCLTLRVCMSGGLPNEVFLLCHWKRRLCQES